MAADIMLRNAIIGEVRKALQEYTEKNEEVYISQRELSERFSFFTPAWLKRYGHLLCREQITVVMEDGEAHATGWGYPLHRINRMIAAGEFRRLQYKEKNLKPQP